MPRLVPALGSLGDRAATALPARGTVAPFEPIAAERFVLEGQGFAEGRAHGDELARGWPPASLAEVLECANRTTTVFPKVLGGRGHGYGWDREDDRTPHWYPQGITGSADADPSGLLTEREVHAVSWYSKRGHGARLSLVDVAARRYRHVLCVRPTGGEGFEPVKVHAGGVAWVRNFIYVADTRRGLRVFDTQRILHVPERSREATHGYAYLMPQVGAFRSTGAALLFSFTSLDRSEPATLAVGEYTRGRGGQVVRWPIDLATGLLTSEKAIEAHRAPVDRLQGVASVAGHLLASSSRRGGRLYVGRASEPLRRLVWWPFHPEDLYVSWPTDEIYSLTEDPGARMVMGVQFAELGL
ncbi:MAG: hypothetical protein WKF29_10325 [Thermoleophilaceae bacterium]